MRTLATTLIATTALCLAMTQVIAEEAAPVAIVDGAPISREQFELGVYNEARQNYFHGRPMTDEKYLAFRRSVADKLVNRVLLLNEAKRRGIDPDQDGVAAELALYEDRYAGTDRWQSEGEVIMAKMRQHLDEESVLSIMERKVRSVDDPQQAEVRNYYETYSEKFTEPQQTRVSLILLAVDPSSAGEIWEAARREAADLVKRISDGESFEKLARLHSADPSGNNGGDMGYMHTGMLGDVAQQVLDEMEIGELSGSVTVLEGIAIFRLTGRKEASLQPFAAVQQRATNLWRRDEGENVWNQTIAGLRSQSDIKIDEAYLLSLPMRRQ